VITRTGNTVKVGGEPCWEATQRVMAAKLTKWLYNCT